MHLEDPRFARRLAELSAASDLPWAFGTALGLTTALIAAFVSPGVVWAYAGLLVRSSIYLWAGDGLSGRGGETLQRLFRMGLVAGLFELVVDFGLVHWVGNGRLVYLSGADVVLLASPVYMPVAWACVITELGYPAIRLFGLWRGRAGDRRAAVAASVLIGVSAAFTVGAYEYLAAAANWWRYERANAMLGGFCALFIPLGEFLMFLPILPIAARAVAEDDKRLGASIAAGALFAGCIAAGYLVAYLLLEAGRPAV